jgi:hypothetical protein
MTPPVINRRNSGLKCAAGNLCGSFSVAAFEEIATAERRLGG